MVNLLADNSKSGRSYFSLSTANTQAFQNYSSSSSSHFFFLLTFRKAEQIVFHIAASERAKANKRVRDNGYRLIYIASVFLHDIWHWITTIYQLCLLQFNFLNDMHTQQLRVAVNNFYLMRVWDAFEHYAPIILLANIFFHIFLYAHAREKARVIFFFIRMQFGRSFFYF